MRTRMLKLAATASVIGIATAMLAAGTAGALSATVACPHGFTKVHDGHDTIRLSACEELFVDGATAHTIVWTGGLVIVHGAGHDTMDYSQASDAVSGELDARIYKGTVTHKGHIAKVRNSKGNLVNQRIGTNGLDKISGIANLIGTPYNDNIYGDANANQLEGRAGDDHIDGKGGNDTLDGGTGRDHIKGSSGSTMNGGDGDDHCLSTAFGPGCNDGYSPWS
jgi:Ca2+-binding RTX toxin-like protein